MSCNPGWRRDRIEVTKALVSSGQRDRKGEAAKATEVLICNEAEGLFS